MASLRKAATSPEVTAAPVAPPEQPPTPPPAPPPEPVSSPQDETGEALRKQIEALRQSEEFNRRQADAIIRQNELALETNKRCQQWLQQTPSAQQHPAEL